VEVSRIDPIRELNENAETQADLNDVASAFG
jgi:hypothetical protein